MAKRPPVRKRINLALQGGGALGAYTWGVLDRFLEDDRIEIEAISGTSAGAMNGVVMCEGYVEGGEVEARAALRRFWEGIARASQSSMFGQSPLSTFFGDWTPSWAKSAFQSPFMMWFDLMSRVASPYDLNPLNLNPLKEVLENLVDFSRVNACDQIRLYVSATNVETGRVRIFTNKELTADHVMASACLPLLFQAVEIDGEPYWDGGYMGNPSLFPLYDRSLSSDCMIVQINPIERPGVPKTSRDIIARINEITFNSSLLAELRAAEFVGRLIDQGRLDEGERYKKVLFHVISDDAALVPLGAGAGLNASMEFFEQLFRIGRLACDRWLDEHFEDLGKRSTVDLRRMFQGDVGPIGAAPVGHRRE
jgi:NTE family protein